MGLKKTGWAEKGAQKQFVSIDVLICQQQNLVSLTIKSLWQQFVWPSLKKGLVLFYSKSLPETKKEGGINPFPVFIISCVLCLKYKKIKTFSKICLIFVVLFASVGNKETSNEKSLEKKSRTVIRKEKNIRGWNR